MSSSDRAPQHEATPWALDELEMPDVFSPIDRLPSASQGDGDNEELGSPQERARIEAAAYAHGRADGEKIVRNDLLTRLESAIAAFQDALETVRLHQSRWMANVEENIAVVAVVAARHIIAREVEADATVVSDLVARALVQFPLDHAITVRLHPEDVATCDEMLKTSNASRSKDVRWVADPLIQLGGCMVEGRERIIDGRVDTSLERAYRLLGNLQA